MAPSSLDNTFAALADPTRREILARLSSGEASVMELAKPFDMSLPAVSKHLKVLERAGLITRGREAQLRPCRLEAEPLKEAVDWLERYRRLWEERFDRLDEYLHELKKGKSEKEEGSQTSGNPSIIYMAHFAMRSDHSPRPFLVRTALQS